MATTKIYITALIILLAVAAGSFYAGRMTAPETEKLEPITFILNWTMGHEHAAFITAADKGFYAEEGLAVTILRGYGSTDSSRRLFAGEGQFGNISNAVLVKARSEGIPLKQIAMGYHLSPVGIFGLPGKGPTTPDEIRGKKIATTTGTEGLQLEIICELNGIDVETEVDRVFMSPPAKVPAVLTGDVDGCAGYVTDEAREIASAAEIPFEDVTKLLFRDWGIDVYGNGIAALDDYIMDNPDIVERFVRASMKGMAWAIQNPEEAAEIVSRWLPELPEEEVLEGWIAVIDLIWNEETQQYGIGYMIPEKIQESIDITAEIYDIEPVPLEETYTNEFVEDLPDEIKFPLAA